MFSMMYALINDWVNNREAGDLRLQYGHYDVIVMFPHQLKNLLDTLLYVLHFSGYIFSSGVNIYNEI